MGFFQDYVAENSHKELTVGCSKSQGGNFSWACRQIVVMLAECWTCPHILYCKCLSLLSILNAFVGFFYWFICNRISRQCQWALLMLCYTGKQHKGGKRHFTNFEAMEEQKKKEEKERQWRVSMRWSSREYKVYCTMILLNEDYRFHQTVVKIA